MAQRDPRSATRALRAPSPGSAGHAPRRHEPRATRAALAAPRPASSLSRARSARLLLPLLCATAWPAHGQRVVPAHRACRPSPVPPACRPSPVPPIARVPRRPGFSCCDVRSMAHLAHARTDMSGPVCVRFASGCTLPSLALNSRPTTQSNQSAPRVDTDRGWMSTGALPGARTNLCRRIPRRRLYPGCRGRVEPP